MKLNTVSYIHARIRLYCHKLENITGLKLKTNLSKEFKLIEFKNEFSYLTIDWESETYSTLSFHLNKTEEQLVQDIILYLIWLDIPRKFVKRKEKNYEKK